MERQCYSSNQQMEVSYLCLSPHVSSYRMTPQRILVVEKEDETKIARQLSSHQLDGHP